MKNKQTICLCILDGWGDDKPTAYNAITIANTPHYNALKENHSFTLLSASGDMLVCLMANLVTPKSATKRLALEELFHKI